MIFRQQALLLAGAVALTLGSASSAAANVVFDNMTSAENGVPGASLTSTGSTPNTFMGDGYVLAAGTTSITGFDLFAVNGTTSTTFTNLKLTVYVWDNVNLGTVSATTPAFSNLLASYTVTSAGTYTNGFYYAFEGNGSTTPGVSLAIPLALADTTIGLTFNIQGSTDNGATFANVSSLTSLISYGVAPTVGSELFNGYYRNAAGETNGNFTSAVRSLGLTNQGVGVRIYGTTASAVPEPSTYLMMCLGLAMFRVMLRRRSNLHLAAARYSVASA